MAGYTEPMNAFIESNPGLRSRFNHYIEFEDYRAEELVEIFESFCRESEYVLDKVAREFLLGRLQKMVNAGQTRSNGRFVRNIYERCVEVQAVRLTNSDDTDGSDMNALNQNDLADAVGEISLEQLPLRAPLRNPGV